MMKYLRIIRNYFFYCGIEKDEYNAIKKDAYISNFEVWRILHFLMAAFFGTLYICSLRFSMLKSNSLLYLLAFVYSVIGIVLLFKLKKDSIIAQLLIYLSISLLFLFGCLISVNKPNIPAVAFIAFLIITPMFMIDKPFFMAIELGAASTVYLLWSHGLKQYDIWRIDLGNVLIFTVVGIFLNVIDNSLRIKEFVLTRKINVQKDTDELTGLKNKGAMTREINQFLSDGSMGKGLLFVMDIDKFKSINDTFGHDIGDDVLRQMGSFLDETFNSDDIIGRFGGDEFIAFIRNNDDPEAARQIADRITEEVPEKVVLENGMQKINISVGIAIYHGEENNYSELFKKADIALYDAKADSENRYRLYTEG